MRRNPTAGRGGRTHLVPAGPVVEAGRAQTVVPVNVAVQAAPARLAVALVAPNLNRNENIVHKYISQKEEESQHLENMFSLALFLVWGLCSRCNAVVGNCQVWEILQSWRVQQNWSFF